MKDISFKVTVCKGVALGFTYYELIVEDSPETIIQIALDHPVTKEELREIALKRLEEMKSNTNIKVGDLI